jgi:hypothetical protein
MHVTFSLKSTLIATAFVALGLALQISIHLLPPTDWPSVLPLSILLMFAGVFVAPLVAIGSFSIAIWTTVKSGKPLYASILVFLFVATGTLDILSVQMDFRRTTADPNWAFAFFDTERYGFLQLLGVCSCALEIAVYRRCPHNIVTLLGIVSGCLSVFLFWYGLEMGLTF